MCAIAHPQEALPIIGAARGDDDLGVLMRGGARDLGKLNVVTDRDREFTEVRLENLQPFAG
ncbi:MAG: hypothetical protein M3Q46_11570 [Verrucomicrobiota bacterium]|nr:hypothetical protein [Verrucomicrobiota bacterium]